MTQAGEHANGRRPYAKHGVTRLKHAVNILGKRAIEYLLAEKFSGPDMLITSLGQFSRTLLPTGEVADSSIARCNTRPALARSRAKDSG